MSHFTKIKAKIKDIQALNAATSKMGFSLNFGGKCRYYYGTKTADAVIKLPGRYDVALSKQDSGEYTMEADLFNNQVEMYIGSGAGLLMQRYSVEKAKIESFKKGLMVTENVKGEDIILTLTDTTNGGQANMVIHVGGKIEFKTTGFPGESCMKFKDLEESLGKIEEMTPTMEMYESEVENKEDETLKSFY